MDQAKARIRILNEWYIWSRDIDNASLADAIGFHAWLQQKKPELLDFPYSGTNRWQIVHAWIRISDKDVMG